ncbi:MAG: lysylphosphatidylglycerol synthase transmembrane domain-containing protein [Phycisphaeraceae bacterium]
MHRANVTKKHLGWVLRLLIAAAGVAYILYTLNWTSRIALPDGSGLHVSRVSERWVTPAKPVETIAGLGDADIVDGRIRRTALEGGDPDQPALEPSFLVVIREARHGLLFAGLCVFAPVFLIGALRWAVLMRARGIEVRYARAYRLTMAGQFFNLCMPGTTGGDVMKAYYAAKGTRQRADAVVSVAIDRVCGLVGLVLLVGIVGLFSLDDPIVRRLTLGMWAGLFALFLVAGLYASKSLRARLRLGALVGKVPGAGPLRKLDALVAAYRHHLGALLAAVGLSLPIHLCLALSMMLAGYALGIDRPAVFLLSTIPIVLLLWALPVSGPLGLGPLDIVAVQLITAGGETTAQQAVMMFVAYRLFAVAVGLGGSLALFGSDAPSRSAASSDTPADLNAV